MSGALVISLDRINYGVIFVPLHLFFQNPTVILLFGFLKFQHPILMVRVFEIHDEWNVKFVWLQRVHNFHVFTWGHFDTSFLLG